MWTFSQRKALLALCVILALFLLIESHRKPIDISDPLPHDSPRSQEIVDRLDPNTADAAALAAIPNLGEKRAAEIVAYREKFILQHPRSTAFESIDELRLLKGFGPATVADLEPYLVFGKANR
jgi:hypothetical protein